MLDHINILSNVANANSYMLAKLFVIAPGADPVRLYFQLYQNDIKIRYVPEAGATIKVDFLRRDSIAVTPVSQTVSKVATQAFTGDASIWYVDLNASDTNKIVTGGFQVTTQEPLAGKKIVFSQLSIRKATDPTDLS